MTLFSPPKALAAILKVSTAVLMASLIGSLAVAVAGSGAVDTASAMTNTNTQVLGQIKDLAVVKEGPYWVSEWSEFTLPPGLMSFQILSFGSPEVYLQITDLIAPDGLAYVQSGASPVLGPYSQPVLKNVISPIRSEAVVQGMSSLIVPNNPELPAPIAGRWKFRALSHAEPAQKLNSFVIIGKFPSASPVSAMTGPQPKLKIRVWISPESYWTLKKDQVEKILAETKANFREAQVDLQVLSIRELPAKTPAPMKLPIEMARIAQIQNAPDAINVYLMPSMEYQNKPVNGLACLGGPIDSPIQHPCFVSMYADHRADEVSLPQQAKILTHELGHYLGLFHTRDSGYYLVGIVLDRLTDTPETVTGTNMMDPGIHDQPPHFTPQQKKMLLLSPALR